MDNGKMNYFGGDLAVSMAGAQSLDELTKESGNCRCCKAKH